MRGSTVLEASGIARMVFESLEQRLAKGVIVADSGSTMGLRDPETLQQLGQKLAGHDAATVGMQRQLPGPKSLPLRAGFDQLAGECGGLGMRHHPAHHVAAIHVLDGIQVDVATVGKCELADVPAPQLIRAGGTELRAYLPSLLCLLASLFGRRVRVENPVHGALATEVALFIQQRRHNVRWRPIDKARRMQLCAHRPALLCAQRARTGALLGRLRRTPPAVVG